MSSIENQAELKKIQQSFDIWMSERMKNTEDGLKMDSSLDKCIREWEQKKVDIEADCEQEKLASEAKRNKRIREWEQDKVFIEAKRKELDNRNLEEQKEIRTMQQWQSSVVTEEDAAITAGTRPSKKPRQKKKRADILSSPAWTAKALACLDTLMSEYDNDDSNLPGDTP